MIQQLNPQLIQPAMKKACSVLDILLRAGFSAYFVGGAVRDTLLCKPIHDIDIATNALPEDVLKLFPHSIPTGLQHGTVTVLHDKEAYEVTTFRSESVYADYRRPTDVAFVNNLELDLQRRDFTMNAMAIDREWKLYDPFGGQADLRNGVLATVGISEERFQEDALRMLRALRFALTYKLRMAESCEQAIMKCGKLLKHIAMERVFYELSRMLQTAPCNDVFQLLQHSKLLQHTKEKLFLGDVSLPMSAELQSRLPQAAKESEASNWGLLFLCFGINSEQAQQDMRALRFSNQLSAEVRTILQLNEWINQVKIAIANISTPPKEAREQKLSAACHLPIELKQQWLHHLLNYSPEQLERWLDDFQWLSPQLMSSLREFHEKLPINSIKQLEVNGKHLLKWYDRPSGAWIKELLQQLFIKVASGKLQNSKEAIQAFVLANNEGECSDEQ